MDDPLANGSMGSVFGGPSTPSKSAKRVVAIDMDAQTGTYRVIRDVHTYEQPIDQANQAFSEALANELFPSNSSSSSLVNAYASPTRSPIRHMSSTSSLNGSGSGATSTSSPHHHQVHHTASSPHRPPQTPSRSRILQINSPSRSQQRDVFGSGMSPHLHPHSGVLTLFAGGVAINAARGLDSPRHEVYNTSPIRESTRDALLSSRPSIRPVAKTPFKVLDAPDLMVGLSVRTSSLD